MLFIHIENLLSKLKSFITFKCLNLLAVFAKYCLISFKGIFFTNFKSWITYKDSSTVKFEEKKNISFKSGRYYKGYSLKIN
jgi:hypothetical protein